MSIFLALLGVVFASYTAAPASGNRFTLEVEKTGLMSGKKHLFSFPKYSGDLQYDPKSAAASKVTFTIDGASMMNEDTWVKESDRKKILEWGLNKMLEVDKHPEITFVSQKVEPVDATHFRVSGPLTMRGVSKPATVAVTTEDQGGGLKLNGTSTLNMKEWGMKPPSAALGTIGTKPEMTVRFQLLFRTGS